MTPSIPSSEEHSPRFEPSHEWPMTPPSERKRAPKKDPRVVAAEAKLKTLKRRDPPPVAAKEKVETVRQTWG